MDTITWGSADAEVAARALDAEADRLVDGGPPALGTVADAHRRFARQLEDAGELVLNAGMVVALEVALDEAARRGDVEAEALLRQVKGAWKVTLQVAR